MKYQINSNPWVVFYDTVWNGYTKLPENATSFNWKQTSVAEIVKNVQALMKIQINYTVKYL